MEGAASASPAERCVAVEAQGYEVLTLLLASDHRHCGCICRRADGSKFYVKVTEAPVARNLEIQHHASGYFRGIMSRLPPQRIAPRWWRWLTGGEPNLAFQETSLIRDGQRAFLISPWIDGVAASSDGAPRLRPADMAAVARFVAALHHPEGVPLPPGLERIAPRISDQVYADRFAFEHLAAALNSGALSEDEVTVMIRTFNDFPAPKRVFAHRDIWEPNLIHGDDGQLWLIDAEFARWEMAGTDPVHFFLQTRLFRGNAYAARSGFVEMFAAIRRVRPSIVQEIWAPFLYLLAAAAARVDGVKEISLLRRLVTLALVRDLEGILSL